MIKTLDTKDYWALMATKCIKNW